MLKKMNKAFSFLYTRKKKYVYIHDITNIGKLEVSNQPSCDSRALLLVGILNVCNVLEKRLINIQRN